MGKESDLLRMLEPVVRPVALPGGGAARPSNTPFESRPFSDLLQEAQVNPQPESLESASASQPAAKAPDPLAALGGVHQISNASLRQLIEQSGTPPTLNPATANAFEIEDNQGATS